MAGTRGRPNAAQMSKRILGGVLWFLAASYAWGFVSAMTGVLPVAALPIGILVGTFVIAASARITKVRAAPRSTGADDYHWLWLHGAGALRAPISTTDHHAT